MISIALNSYDELSTQAKKNALKNYMEKYGQDLSDWCSFDMHNLLDEPMNYGLDNVRNDYGFDLINFMQDLNATGHFKWYIDWDSQVNILRLEVDDDRYMWDFFDLMIKNCDVAKDLAYRSLSDSARYELIDRLVDMTDYRSVTDFDIPDNLKIVEGDIAKMLHKLMQDSISEICSRLNQIIDSYFMNEDYIEEMISSDVEMGNIAFTKMGTLIDLREQATA